MKGIIYKYTSPSGKSYIGQTVRPKERMAKHRRMDGDCAFHRAINKYGFDNFQYEVLVTVDLDDEQELKQKLDFFEKFYIRKYHSYENGYNETLGGGGRLGFKVSEETKQKLSDSLKGNKNSLGFKMSDESKQKKSVALKGNKNSLGRIHSDETRRKISESNKGKHFLSDEARRKISEAHKGKPSALKGRVISDEHKKKLSEAHKGKPTWNKGKPMSEEQKLKIREAWAKKKQQNLC